ncbi:MAG: D-alanine--D-alanine ligase [Planctomycetota bacterium]|nr:MAG: D-alanine--D-alanine ligase [Planctomycetota bacterium]
MRVCVLGGGPDAEREVSVRSAANIARALAQAEGFEVALRIVDDLTVEEAEAIEADVVWPALHGPWGEGGPVQSLLEQAGKRFVGSASRAARLAMDKLATKLAAASLGVATPPAALVRRDDAACPFEFPCVVKPVHEGSTIGLWVCSDEQQWREARDAALRREGPCMVEPFVKGRELTVGLVQRREGAAVQWRALPTIEIVPAEGLYDYEAKYSRCDTRYALSPPLPAGCEEELRVWSLRLVEALGCASLARVDFILDDAGNAVLLELNTMPGFTEHSLLPMAAEAEGMSVRALCASLVELAAERCGTVVA